MLRIRSLCFLAGIERMKLGEKGKQATFLTCKELISF